LDDTTIAHREATLYRWYRNVEFYIVPMVIGRMLSTEKIKINQIFFVI